MDANGNLLISKAALKRGTDRYINARIQTPKEKKAVMNLIAKWQSYKITVTDLPVMSEYEDDEGNYHYSLIDGETKPGKLMVISTTTLTNKAIT